MSNIRLINLSKDSAPEPIENKSKGWVTNGKKNEYFNFLIEKIKESPTHRAILNNYFNMIYGKGLMIKGNDMEKWMKIKSVLKQQDIKSMLWDFVVFNTYSAQIIKNRGKGLSSISHLGVNKLAPEIEDENGNINSYFFSKDWAKPYTNTPIQIPVFSGKKNKEVYVYKPYTLGNDYFSDPRYLAGIQYATLEGEIANYYVNHIKNGLSFGYIINVPDGTDLTDKQKDDLENKLRDKITGTENAGRFILNFQVGEAKITVDVLEINDAHKQWQYLTQEARQQLLTAHGVVSPILFGIKDNTGFGNNAEELATARQQTIDYVIKPIRNDFLKPLEMILEEYDIYVDLYFADIEVEQPKTELSVKKKNELDLFLENSEDEEDLLKDFDIAAECDVDYKEEDKIHLEFASTGTARPNAKSEQDFDTHLIRYKYTGKKTGDREFCNKMLSKKKVYRKEDIVQLENKAVNPGFGEKGAKTYSIWLYKGGARCSHKWQRVIYLRKGTNVDANSPLASLISTTKARQKGLEIPTNDNKVSIMPRNMKNKGFVNPPSKKDIQPGI